MAEGGKKQREDSLKAFFQQGCHVYTLHLHPYNVTIMLNKLPELFKKLVEPLHNCFNNFYLQQYV